MTALRVLASFMLLAAVATGAFFALSSPWNQTQTELTSRITAASKDIEDLQARIRSIDASGPSVGFPEELLWQAPSGSEAALALQDTLLQLAKSHNISILTFGTTQVSKNTSQQTAAVTLEGESNLENFYRFLNTVENLSPKAAPAVIRIRPRISGINSLGGTGIYFQTTVWNFWEKGT